MAVSLEGKCCPPLLFLAEAPSQEKNSAASEVCSNHLLQQWVLPLAFLAGELLSSCWLWAVSFSTHAKGLWFILLTVTILLGLFPALPRTCGILELKTRMVMSGSSNTPSLFTSLLKFQNYCSALTMEVSHLIGHHTSSALCCVEHIMFCPKYIHIHREREILYAVRRKHNKTLDFLCFLVFTNKEVSIYFESCDHYTRMF